LARECTFHGTGEYQALQSLKLCREVGTADRLACFLRTNFISGRTYMLAKYMTAGLVGSALLATVAFAQTPTATGDRTNMAPAAASDTSSSFEGNWRASKVVGLNVYNDSNESLGSINDLLTDKSGNIKAVIIGVGGFLGVGEHLVAIPFEKVKFVNEPVAYTGAANSAGSRPASSTTTGAAPATATASKPNPWYPDHAQISATKDELKAMPEFKYST
jgi:sporulation protein YlmC with PRC-barrel domain